MEVRSLENNLRSYRKAAGLTQFQLAQRCGTTYVSINRYEAGVRIPKIIVARKIAQALNCQVEDIWPVDNKANQE